MDQKKTETYWAKVVNNSQLNSSSITQKTSRPTKTNFAYAHRPIYYFSRMFGLFPFTIIYDWNGDIQEARVKVLDIAWFFISLVGYLAMAFYCYMTEDIPKFSVELRVLILGDFMLVTAGLLFGAVFVVMDMHNRHILVDFMKKLTKFDHELTKIGFYVPYKKLRRHGLYWYIATWIIAVVLAISLIFYSTFPDLYSARRVFAYFFCNLAQYFAGVTIVTSYIIWIIAISKRLDLLNSLMRDKFLNKNTLSIGYNKRESISFIKFTGRQHELLTGILKQVNHCYALQAMFNVGFTFIFSVLCLYTFYRYYLQQNETFKQLSYLHCTWQIFYLFYTFVLIYAGSKIASSGKNSVELIHNIINRCNNDDVNSSLSQLSQQIQSRYPVASCGLFVFDWTLLYAMIGSITTYVTIVVQFNTNPMGNSKTCENCT